jgi:methionine synthase II (cobalamin-independent)
VLKAHVWSARLARVKHLVTVRADIVGSLLRPPQLLEARERYASGGLSAAEFKRIEDRAVEGAIDLQERAGLPVVTDGEIGDHPDVTFSFHLCRGNQGSRWRAASSAG